MYDMPLSDAVLVENGAFTRVSRIARAIETNEALATEYAKPSGLTKALIAKAVSMVEEKYGSFEGIGKARGGVYGGDIDKALLRRASLGGPGSFAAKLQAGITGARKRIMGADGKPIRVTLTDRRKIANYLKVRTAYDNALERKKMLRKAALGAKPQGMQFIDRATGQIATSFGKGTGRKAFAKDMKPVYEHTGDRDARARARKAAAAEASYQALLYSGGADVSRRSKRKEIRKSTRDLVASQAEYNAYLASLRAPPTPPSSRRGDFGAGRAGGGGGGGKLTEALKLAKKLKDGGMSWEAAKAQASEKFGVKLPKGKTSANPFSGLGDLALVSNPSGIALLDSVEGAVAGVPVVGEYVAPLVTPAALGAAAFGVHFFAVPYVEKYLPDAAKPFAYTIGGSLVGVASGVVAAKASDSTVRNAAALVGGAAVAIGVGLDLFRKFGGGSTAGDDDFGAVALENRGLGAVALENNGMFGAYEYTGQGALGAVALENTGMFGDGMAYQLAPVSLGFDGEVSALQGAYGRASLADAYFSGPDFDAAEGEALLNGASEFGRAAGSVPYGAAGAKKHHSALAGRRFHRWGWLIKLVGFQNAQQIAGLPPEERLKVINALRKQALSTYQAHMAASGSAAASALPAGIGPTGPMAPAAAPGVGDDFGYGALAVADY
jgi:hypothetical protein